MEDFTCDPNDLDYPDAWMWSFEDDDASRDAMKKAHQMVFFCLYLIPGFFVHGAFLTHKDDHDHDSCSSAAHTRRVGVASFAIALRCAVKRVYI